MHKIVKSFSISKTNCFNALRIKDGRMTFIDETMISCAFNAPEIFAGYEGMLDLAKYKKIMAKFGTISHANSDGTIVFTDGDSTIAMQSTPADQHSNYVSDAGKELDAQIAIPLKDIVKAMQYCKQSVSDEDARFYLHNYCIDVDDSAIITTDGRRLSRHGIKISKEASECDASYLVRKDAADMFLKVAECYDNCIVTIGQEDNQFLTIKFADVVINAALRQDSFPNWRQVVPKSTTQSFTIDAKEIKRLQKVLAKTITMTHGDKGTSFIFGRDEITVATDNKEFRKEWGVVETKIKAKIEATCEAIMLNAVSLRDALANTTGNVTFSFNNELAPCSLHDDGNKKAYTLIMQMKRHMATESEEDK